MFLVVELTLGARDTPADGAESPQALRWKARTVAVTGMFPRLIVAGLHLVYEHKRYNRESRHIFPSAKGNRLLVSFDVSSAATDTSDGIAEIKSFYFISPCHCS